MGVGFDKARAAHLCDVLAPERLTRIVDVGANPINVNPYSGLLALGRCDVWGFEPHPAAYARLVQGAGPNEHYVPHAVGVDGPAEFKVCESSGFSSLLEPNIATFDALGRFHQGARVIERIAVETRSLDTLEDVPEFDLLKIDIQGGEVAVFEGGRSRLDRAVAVVTETAGTRIYVDQPLFDAQSVLLRELGFDFHKFLSINSFSFRNRFTDRMHLRKFRSQFVDGDAVFVRSLLTLPRLDDERLKHLAILADSVFNSQDLTVAAMAVLADRGRLTDDAVHGYLDFLPFVSARIPEATA